MGGAIAHWWILRENSDRDSGHFAPGGHVAALYQDELYELTAGRSGLSRLQSFGVIFGTDRVVIYVEPLGTSAKPVTANTACTHLLLGGEALDWEIWAAEFREQMPEDLRAMQEQISAQGVQEGHRRAILERLRQIQDLLRFKQYVARDSGKDIRAQKRRGWFTFAQMPAGQPVWVARLTGASGRDILPALTCASIKTVNGARSSRNSGST